ncbi:hypothetical protein DdX_15833 [Ditylenchus destructor]|uniref:Uncharacterized protein n=1 Tax=Ditylenchus destructor TaxID=166010 RepID=A0AAD4MPN7_9BILA|nr:hypothetical protein DdX_15833 [Ditylenchus destructor]
MECGEASKKNVDHDSQQVREQVYFSNDSILEAAKSLNYEKCSQMRFLCRRVNQLIQSNQSKLQAFEVSSLEMREEIGCRSNSIVSFDQEIQSAVTIKKWFQDRGYSCDETTDIPFEEVFAGLNLSYSSPFGGNGLHFTVRAFFVEPKEKSMPLTRDQEKLKMERSLPNTVHSKPPQVFGAKFNDEYEFYGPILSYFFRLLHHPAAYFREVSIFPPMTDKFCYEASKNLIRCDQFTLQDLDWTSLEHSLKWLKDTVRAQTITFSFNYDDVIPSDLHSLVSDFFLQNASICARDRLKLEWLQRSGEFLNGLIQKYETLEVTKAIPSIVLEFRLGYKWDTGVLGFFVSSLESIDYPPLYDKRCDRCDIKNYERPIKLDGSRKMIAQVRRCFHRDCLRGDYANPYFLYFKSMDVDHDPQQVREPVYFSNDTILEAAKFLNYQKWSQMRFLCRRVNQLIQSNQSKLQAFEVTSLRMSVFTRIFHKTIDISNICKSNSIVSFNQAIQSADAVRKWFQDRGYSCDETTDIPLEKVFADWNLYGLYSPNPGLRVDVRAFFDEPIEKNMPLTRDQAKRTGKAHKKNGRLPNAVVVHSEPSKVFSAHFDAKYEFYGPILSYFFRLIYHPAAYFREVLMFTPMTDKFCDMTAHSPIRCDQFTLKLLHSSLEHSLEWLRDNVRAQQIILSFNYDDAIHNSDLHILLSEFLLLDGSICAEDRIKLTDWLPHPGEFVKALIKVSQMHSL